MPAGTMDSALRCRRWDMGDVGDGVEAIGAMSCTNYRRASRMYKPGRICSEAACATVLSVYNPEDRCARHAVVTVVPTRRKRASLQKAS